MTPDDSSPAPANNASTITGTSNRKRATIRSRIGGNNSGSGGLTYHHTYQRSYLQQNGPDAKAVLSCVTTPHGPPTPALPASMSTAADRFLELELMHRWMTRTWTYLYGFPGDEKDMLQHLPRVALQYPYLMNGLLSAAAADMARDRSKSKGGSAEARRYLLAALEYGNSSSADFRMQLADIRRENIYAIFNSGLLTAVTHFLLSEAEDDDGDGTVTSPTTGFSSGFSRRVPTALERVLSYFDMEYGAYQVAMHHMQWYLQCPGSTMDVIRYLQSEDIKHARVAADDKAGLKLLDSVSKQVRIPAPLDDDSGGGGYGDNDHGNDDGAINNQQPLYSEVHTYKLAIEQIKLSFVVDSQQVLKGFCLSLATATGPDFVALVRALDPMALLIMAYFGVLFDRMGRDERIGWWVGGTGRALVAEISDMLMLQQGHEGQGLGEVITGVPDGRRVLAWVRRQVGLPPVTTTSSPKDGVGAWEGVEDSWGDAVMRSGSEGADQVTTSSDSIISDVSAS